MSDDLLHFEDFPVGEVVDLGRYEVTAEEIKAFAAEFDPLPFHTDEAAARETVMGGLCASGWHIAAMLMRIMCDTYLLDAAGMGSNGIDEVKWLKPVRPGDVLSVRRETLAARVSSRRPEMGIITFRWTMLNQRGEPVTEMRGVNLMRTRAAKAEAADA